MMLICWTWDVSPLADPRRFEAGMSALPWEKRREKVLSYRFGKDRRLCLGAGLLAAYALREAGVRDLAMDFLAFGKPVLANCPGIHFNLSHSGTLAVCAVSDRPVGVDAEEMQKADMRVADLCFQPAEKEWILASADPDRSFTRLWVRKESFLKLLGTGFSRPANTFSALPGEKTEGGPRFAEREENNCLLCVCSPGQDGPADPPAVSWRKLQDADI